MKILSLLLLSIVLGGCGVTASSNNPGYAHFDTPRNASLKPGTSISLGPRLLKFAARHVDDDPRTRALLQSLNGVRVSVYQLPKSSNRAALDAQVSIATATAFDERWSPIVRVLEEDSRVQIFVREQEGMLLGVAVVAMDREELVFVNVMGELDADTLGLLSSAVPGMDSLALITPPKA